MVLRRRFDPVAALEAVAAHRATHLVGVPVMLQRILALPPVERARHDTSSLRAVASAGAPLAPDVGTAFMDTFGDIVFDLGDPVSPIVATWTGMTAADVGALAVHLMTNTALTGATFDIDGGQQFVSG